MTRPIIRRTVASEPNAHITVIDCELSPEVREGLNLGPYRLATPPPAPQSVEGHEVGQARGSGSRAGTVNFTLPGVRLRGCLL